MEGTSVRNLKTMYVFYGANPGKDGSYVMAANALGVEMTQRKIDLAYGRDCLGLTGCVSYAVWAWACFRY